MLIGDDHSSTIENLLFGGRNKDDSSSSDRVSSAYRQWLDKLTYSVRLASPGVPYVAVRSESLVGLFTCVFVKSDLKDAVRDVQLCTVKR